MKERAVMAIERAVTTWPGISTRPHRFGATEFRLRSAEVGHVHEGGVVDIPFPRFIRDALLAEALANEHHWVPNSGWTTFHVRTEADAKHAVWLMRLSYLRYVLKTAANPRMLLEQESAELRLSPMLMALLADLLPQGNRGGNL